MGPCVYINTYEDTHAGTLSTHVLHLITNTRSSDDWQDEQKTTSSVC